MKISQINNYNQNFGELYKSEDVLRLVTGYPYKGKGSEKFIKALTGIDMYSPEVKAQIPKDAEYSYVMIAIENACEERVTSQNKEFPQIKKDFLKVLIHAKDEQTKRSAFEELLKKFGKTIELKPFSLTLKDIEKSYKDWLDVLKHVQDLMYEEYRKSSQK